MWFCLLTYMLCCITCANPREFNVELACPANFSLNAPTRIAKHIRPYWSSLRLLKLLQLNGLQWQGKEDRQLLLNGIRGFQGLSLADLACLYLAFGTKMTPTALRTILATLGLPIPCARLTLPLAVEC